MKKILNIAFATYVILTALSNLNAASEADVAAVEEVDAALVRGCQTEALQTFKCPLELPGFYKINPEGLKEFLSVVPAAQNFTQNKKMLLKRQVYPLMTMQGLLNFKQRKL